MEFELNPPKLGKIESVGESCSGLDRTESTVNGADMVGWSNGGTFIGIQAKSKTEKLGGAREEEGSTALNGYKEMRRRGRVLST